MAGIQKQQQPRLPNQRIIRSSYADYSRAPETVPLGRPGFWKVRLHPVRYMNWFFVDGVDGQVWSGQPNNLQSY